MMLDSTKLYQSHKLNNHKLSCKVKKLIIALLKKKYYLRNLFVVD
ncbi:hypothetical protein ACP8HZ_07080 [Francisella noatunensis]